MVRLRDTIVSELNKYVNGLVFHAIMKYGMFKYKKNIIR